MGDSALLEMWQSLGNLGDNVIKPFMEIMNGQNTQKYLSLAFKPILMLVVKGPTLEV